MNTVYLYYQRDLIGCTSGNYNYAEILSQPIKKANLVDIQILRLVGNITKKEDLVNLIHPKDTSRTGEAKVK